MIADENYNSMIATLATPNALLSLGAVWLALRGAESFSTKMEEWLERHANEIVYHDGDYD